MKQRFFFYQGTARNFGHFGFLNPGDRIAVDNTNIADDMERDTTNWLEQPTAATQARGADVAKTADYTATTADRTIRFNKASAGQVTLPPAPVKGQIIEVHDTSGNASANNITIARNGKTIDGAASNVVINTNSGTKRLFYDGAGWRTF